jgi:hypothetical protein
MKAQHIATKTHYRTWKSGKKWLFSSAALAAAVISVSGVSATHTKADTYHDSILTSLGGHVSDLPASVTSSSVPLSVAYLANNQIADSELNSLQGQISNPNRDQVLQSLVAGAQQNHQTNGQDAVLASLVADAHRQNPQPPTQPSNPVGNDSSSTNNSNSLNNSASNQVGSNNSFDSDGRGSAIVSNSVEDSTVNTSQSTNDSDSNALGVNSFVNSTGLASGSAIISNSVEDSTVNTSQSTNDSDSSPLGTNSFVNSNGHGEAVIDSNGVVTIISDSDSILSASTADSEIIANNSEGEAEIGPDGKVTILSSNASSEASVNGVTITPDGYYQEAMIDSNGTVTYLSNNANSETTTTTDGVTYYPEDFGGTAEINAQGQVISMDAGTSAAIAGLLNYGTAAAGASAGVYPYSDVYDVIYASSYSSGGNNYLSWEVGTGELIAPNVLLTAGHVVYENGKYTYQQDPYAKVFKADGNGVTTAVSALLGYGTDSQSSSYAIVGATVNPVFSSDANANSVYNPTDDLGLLYLSGATGASYIPLTTNFAVGENTTVAGYPGDYYTGNNNGTLMISTSNTVSSIDGTNNVVTMTGATNMAGLQGSVIFPGLSGGGYFDSSNELGAVHTEATTISTGSGTSYGYGGVIIDAATLNWIEGTASVYDATQSIANVGLAATGTWGTAKWTLSNAGALTIGSGTMGSTTLAADDPMIVLADVVTSINITGALTGTTSSLQNLFANLPKVTSITGLTNVSVPSGTSVSGMFSNDPKANLYGNGPAVNVSGMTAVNYKATVASDWNLCSQPWSTDVYYDNVFGTNYIGATVTVTGELSEGSATAALITLPNGQSYWVDKASLNVIPNNYYGNGPAIIDSSAQTTSFSAKVVSDWNLCQTSTYGNTLAWYDNVGGTNYVGSIVTVNELASDLAALITLPNGQSYWVDSESLVNENPSGLVAANRQTTIKQNWNIVSSPLFDGSMYSLGYLSNLGGNNFVGTAVTVTATDNGFSLIKLIDGKSYWVDSNALN